MKKFIKSVLAIAILGFVGLGIYSSVYAQRTGITLSPVNFELTADPGDVVSSTIKIYNPSNAVIHVTTQVEDFTVAGETGQVVVESTESNSYSLASWVTTIPDTLTLQPGERQSIEFVIEVPENAEPGGHYGSILASTSGVVGGEGFTGTAIAQKVGALVLLSVSGEIREELSISEFSAPDFLETGPVPFVIRFQNEGTVHVKPMGFITIANWRGTKVFDLEFPQKNVLPDSIRKIETQWERKWLFGKYTAAVVGSYGNSPITIEPWIVTFWVLPWKIMAGAGIALFAALLFFFFTRKRWMGAAKILLKGDSKR